MGNTSQMDYEAVQQAYRDVHDKEGTAHSIPVTNQNLALTNETTNQDEGGAEGVSEPHEPEHASTEGGAEGGK